jgi:hypothetical protein
MARKSTLTLIFLFAGLFMLAMVIYAGISAARDVNTVENTTEYQNIDQTQHDAIVEQEKPFVIGISGLMVLLVVILILAGIGLFMKLILKGQVGREM